MYNRTNYNHERLRKYLSIRFSANELKAICFDLSIDYEELLLGASTKSMLVIELLRWLLRNGKLQLLLEWLKREGEDISQFSEDKRRHIEYQIRRQHKKLTQNFKRDTFEVLQNYLRPHYVEILIKGYYEDNLESVWPPMELGGFAPPAIEPPPLLHN